MGLAPVFIAARRDNVTCRDPEVRFFVREERKGRKESKNAWEFSAIFHFLGGISDAFACLRVLCVARATSTRVAVQQLAACRSKAHLTLCGPMPCW
jgi:hypothetical protein